MPFTFVLMTLYALSLITAITGFSRKLFILKILAVIIFLTAVILTAVLGVALNRM